jgi:Secretion system C-terminal sorting domain
MSRIRSFTTKQKINIKTKMRKVIFTLACALGMYTSTTAQCSQVPNNFEMKLTQVSVGKLAVQIRHTDAEGAQSVAPVSSQSLFGMIFAISWPKTSNITLENAASGNKPFEIGEDKFAWTAQNKNVSNEDNMATFYHTNDMPAEFGYNWENNKWYDVAVISYKGNLAEGDMFSFATCDYGVAHPNSYAGNSHTDPWFAVYDMRTSVYNEFSPRMITERSAQFSAPVISIYPNPATTDITVDVTCGVSSQVAAQITDITGKVVSNSIFKVQKGNTKQTISVAGLAPGNYMVKLTDGKTLNYVQKFEKQ